LGEWNVIALRLYNFDIEKSTQAMTKISKENLAKAFVTKMMHDK